MKSRGGSRQRKIDKLARENEMLKQQLAQAGQIKAESPAEQKPEGTARPKSFDYGRRTSSRTAG